MPYLSNFGSNGGERPCRGICIGRRDVNAGGFQFRDLSGTDLWILFGARYRSDNNGSTLTAMGF